MREQMCARHQGRAGGHRPFGAVCGRLAQCHTAPSKVVTARLPTAIRLRSSAPARAGLTCAGDLAKMGYEVTVFEALHAAGGVLLMLRTPEFRLPQGGRRPGGRHRSRRLGVQYRNRYGHRPSVLSVDELFERGYEAVFIRLRRRASPALWASRRGETCKGVYSANEYLTRVNLMKAYRDDSDTPIAACPSRVAVVGPAATSPWTPPGAQNGWAPRTVYHRLPPFGWTSFPARAEESPACPGGGHSCSSCSTNPVEILAG